jgi:hypothetical protein
MQEEGIPKEEYEFGKLERGRRYKRKNIVDAKGELCSEPKGRELCALVRIMEIPYIGGEEEEFQSSNKRVSNSYSNRVPCRIHDPMCVTTIRDNI